ncbi:hypothetical protein KIPB_002691 [Kipferlia bialata]|uniref:Uncharacterized protein n=1 Tax=Kipferlia bialata TaxID=797122 RepID=A0A391NPT0_9EUKA|nr:hypothetical protein KIPB_002691 [Kipferlia bialata]|eukprot:g2691.t1
MYPPADSDYPFPVPASYLPHHRSHHRAQPDPHPPQYPVAASPQHVPSCSLCPCAKPPVYVQTRFTDTICTTTPVPNVMPNRCPIHVPTFRLSPCS